MSIISEVIESTKAIIQGMGVTLSYIPKRKWTVQYPDEPVTMQPRYRGQHLLHVDELGREKCVACYLCAAACPSECIYIVAADDPRPPEERIGIDERYAAVYNIDYGRCIFCGYCVEACPKDAITHGYNFELSVYSRADLLKTKDDLLITKQLQSKTIESRCRMKTSIRSTRKSKRVKEYLTTKAQRHEFDFVFLCLCG
jgi:NADH-quinone oxidoreductase, chain I